ncbi:MAG: hypothetical protein HY040_22320 [Planctomycetes bacterium]|nr:hypothetical protein [Planctomycetota bacterium]
MFRESLGNIGVALREPEEFAWRWHRLGSPYPWWVFAALGLTAIAGTLSYGMTIGLLGGAPRMLSSALSCTVAAGIAWSLPLPALYILNSLTGSKLKPSTTFLAALVTTSWGGLAMIASIPVNLFFTTALPYWPVILAINLVVFAGVGIAMIDVFSRVMAKLEPERGRAPAIWLFLVGAIGAELFYAFGLFQFAVIP